MDISKSTHSALLDMTPRQIGEYLKSVGRVCPIFIWGPPGIGKSALIEQFAHYSGLECTTLMGSQLTPEDIYGIAQVVDGRTQFCPPRMIAKDYPYCLFLDEFNACSSEVQKAFYSLVHDRRIGEYKMPEGCMILAAGNRLHDGAIVNILSSALINRMTHINMIPSFDDWMEWAISQDVHPLVLDYLRAYPGHLHDTPDEASQLPFSSPRTWHILSSGLKQMNNDTPQIQIEALAKGCLTPAHAYTFLEVTKTGHQQYTLAGLLAGKDPWPESEEERPHLRYLANQLRSYMQDAIPANQLSITDEDRIIAARGLELFQDLARIDIAVARKVVQEKKDNQELPEWFLTELIMAEPRLSLN
jgi:hypothetical protein